MLTNPTIETLKTLKLYGMLEALEEQQQSLAIQALTFEERFAALIDRERFPATTNAASGSCAGRI